MDWKKGYATINLDEYTFSGVFGSYELRRDSLELIIYPRRDYKFKRHSCKETSKEKVEIEIESIKSSKKSNQQI